MSLHDVPVPHSDGRWINERISRVVELIREYDPYLEVTWIPPEKRAPNDPAFAIIEHRMGQQRQVVFFVDSEKDFDERVLARIYAGDLSKNSVLDNLDAQNKAVRDMQRKKHEEEMDEAFEYAATVFKSPLHTYRGLNGKVYR